jgi:hypothetical protein
VADVADCMTARLHDFFKDFPLNDNSINLSQEPQNCRTAELQNIFLLPVLPFQFLDFFSDSQVISFVFDEVISFFKFPDYIAGTVNLADAGFKNEIVIYTCQAFSLEDRMESDVFIAEISNDG